MPSIVLLTHFFGAASVLLCSVSHFNLVNSYNQTHVDASPGLDFRPKQRHFPKLSEVVLRDGLIIHSLLFHADRRGERLEVEAEGRDDTRFRAAMLRHVTLLESEPNPLADHFCSGCMRIVEGDQADADGNPTYKSRSTNLTFFSLPLFLIGALSIKLIAATYFSR